MSVPTAPPPPAITPAGKPVVPIPGGIQDNWPSFEQCPQFKLGLMDRAGFYPWEREDYNFDFESVYPPIPNNFPEWAKRIVNLTKHMETAPTPPEETTDCPICPMVPHPEEGYKIEEHRSWSMVPFPCAWHVATHHLWDMDYGIQRPCLIKPDDLARTKRYLRLLRNTRGYDIDCYPHPSLLPNCLCIGDQYMVDCVTTKLQEENGVIAHITRKTEKLHVLKKVHKVVWRKYSIYLVTFSAIDVEKGSEEKFLATLRGNTTILECLRHPRVDAPMPVMSEYIIQPADLPYPIRSFVD